MARLPTCPDCGIDITDKSAAKKISGRWVCPNCLQIREQNTKDRLELYNYVSRLFNINYPTGMMMKQIKTFKEELNYTYKGMYLTLVYWNETLENTMDAKGVGIIPYIYEDAKNFYIEKLKISRQVETMNQPLTKNKTVKIYKNNNNKNNEYLQNRIIDMNNL